MGLPTDPSNLGPQAGNSFWNESLLDRPLVGVPVAYPVGFGQGMVSNAEQQNGSGWQQQTADSDINNTDAGTAGGELQAATHEGGLPNDAAAGASANDGGEGTSGDASADAYNLYELLGGRELHPDMPDRPMSFSQHYNHQNPTRDQAPSASYRTYVQNSLARTYEQQQQQQGKGEGDKAGGENGLLPSESALNAVAAAAAAAAEAEGKEGLDQDAQGNNLAAEWYAWENFSQMLNNRQ